MYSVTLLVTLLAVFKLVSSMPEERYVYLVMEASGNDTFDCGDLPEKKPGDPYDCDKTPAGDFYKVKFPKLYAGNTTTILSAHQKLKNHYDQGKVTAECQTEFAQGICNIAIPACHKDKKKIVSLTNKRICLQSVAICLKDVGQHDINEAKEWCTLVPDNNAKMFKYADAFNSGTKVFCAIPIFMISFITLAF